MKREVYKYFKNLEDSSLTKRNGIYLYDYMHIKEASEDVKEDFSGLFPVVIDNKTTYIGKRVYNKLNKFDLNILASAKLYNDLGIPTPPAYVLKNDYYYTLTQDVTNLNNLNTELGRNIPEIFHISKFQIGTTASDTSRKWQLLFNQEAKDSLLEIMTPECLEEFINNFIISELRMDGDTHSNNFFLYKKPNDKKFIGVIPIDLEYSAPLNYGAFSKKEFENYISEYPYYTYSPYNIPCLHTYHEQHRAICELIHKGVLSPSQIELLKELLNYNFPKVIKETHEDVKAHTRIGEGKKLYDSISRLWEYNINHLGHELGM